MNNKSNEYGVKDNSYKMAGELTGITKLVDAFYKNMDTFSNARKIRSMHSFDLSESKQKLSYFLAGWLGGPKLYSEHYGKINIPLAHKHISIGIEESEAWINCMQSAVDEQPYEPLFKKYLMEQLRVPAKRIIMAQNSNNKQNKE